MGGASGQIAGTDRTRQFIHDDRAVANIILGKGIPPPPPTDKGWHLASFAGETSARLALNGYVDLAHSFEARDSGTATR